MDGSMKDLHHKTEKKKDCTKREIYNVSVPVLHVFIEVKPFSLWNIHPMNCCYQD